MPQPEAVSAAPVNDDIHRSPPGERLGKIAFAIALALFTNSGPCRYIVKEDGISDDCWVAVPLGRVDCARQPKAGHLLRPMRESCPIKLRMLKLRDLLWKPAPPSPSSKSRRRVMLVAHRTPDGRVWRVRNSQLFSAHSPGQVLD